MFFNFLHFKMIFYKNYNSKVINKYFFIYIFSYNKLLQENITAEYKKSDPGIIEKLNEETSNISINTM